MGCALQLLWGRQDRILEKDCPERFMRDLPRATMCFVEECGHVPHLEQPVATRDAILAFARKPSERSRGTVV